MFLLPCNNLTNGYVSTVYTRYHDKTKGAERGFKRKRLTSRIERSKGAKKHGDLYMLLAALHKRSKKKKEGDTTKMV